MKINGHEITAELIEDPPLFVNRGKDPTVQEEPNHDLIPILTQQFQNFRPRRVFEYSHILIWELNDDSGDVGVESILPSRRALEAVREQMLRALIAGVMFEKLLYDEINYLRSEIVRWRIHLTAHGVLQLPTSDWGEVGPVSVLTRMERDWDWVKAR